MASASEVVDADSVGDVSECAPARVFDLTASLDVECDFPAVLSWKFQLNLFCVTDRGASGAVLVCEQCKKATMNIEGPPVRAVPESLRRRPTPHFSHCKAVPEGMRSRAPPPPEGCRCN